jgi:hypothetical protein
MNATNFAAVDNKNVPCVAQLHKSVRCFYLPVMFIYCAYNTVITKLIVSLCLVNHLKPSDYFTYYQV